MPCIFWIEIKGLSCVCSILIDCPFEPSVLINWPTMWSWNRRKEASTLRSGDSRKQIYNYPKSWVLFCSLYIQRINWCITHMNSWLVNTSHNLISAQWLIMMHTHSFVCLYCIYMWLLCDTLTCLLSWEPWVQGTAGEKILWSHLASTQFLSVSSLLISWEGGCVIDRFVIWKKMFFPTILLILILVPKISQCYSLKSQFRLTKNHYS